MKVGEVNRQDVHSDSEYVWALRDINLEVKQGEVLGIIGKNGAGKSTLLKILARVTGPTTGQIKVKGRIGSLLEVGTGFHPELTGRENIFLNGAILGMTRAEVRAKFDAIVDFAGIERYIDTPVKRYSSGMYVRLAFAVAAFLEPEILIVDEVLAVGDAEFQKRALGKMQDVSVNEGRTVLFVSHNLTAIDFLCQKVIVLKNGSIAFNGMTEEGVRFYLNSTQKTELADISQQLKAIPFSEEFKLLNIEIFQDNLIDNFLSTNEINIQIHYRLKKSIRGVRIGYDLIDSTKGLVIFRTFHDENDNDTKIMETGEYFSISKIPKNLLKEGSYKLSLAIGLHNVKWFVFEQVIIKFNILQVGGVNKIYSDKRPGVISPFIQWTTIKNN